MHYAADRGRREVSVIYPFLVASMALGHASTAQASKVYVFRTEPNTTFQVRRNNLATQTVTSTAMGSLQLQLATASGDRFELIPAAGQPPAPPLSVVVGSEAPSGVYYFAVQARTSSGALSAYSSERSVPIQTTGALIAAFDAQVTGVGVRLSWRVVSSETLLGYRLYRSGDGASEALIAEGIDAGANFFIDTDVPGRAYAYVLSAMLPDGTEMRSLLATAEIPFTLAQTGRVVVRVFDVAGSHVATVFDGQMAEGRQTVDWDGRDVRGQQVASGVYLYTLSAGARTLSKKMVMVK